VAQRFKRIQPRDLQKGKKLETTPTFFVCLEPDAITFRIEKLESEW
jgi:hypothetical protein